MVSGASKRRGPRRRPESGARLEQGRQKRWATRLSDPHIGAFHRRLSSGLFDSAIRTGLTRAAFCWILYVSIIDMSKQQNEVPYGTLDLLILKTLETMGRMHGYAIARRIEQVAGESLQLSQGSVYPALIRLEQEGWISTEWGVS